LCPIPFATILSKTIFLIQNYFVIYKLLQQLFKARSLQLTINYIHDRNHKMKLISLHKDVKKPVKMEKESEFATILSKTIFLIQNYFVIF
jgi:hypothetical protein